tara:strand:+ start:254 stop:1132 length:879 start_codon:yes stop_codon:yes gene_type:complete
MKFSWRGLNNAYQRKRLEDRADKEREQEIALARENSLLELGLTKEKDRVKFRSEKPYREAAEATLKLEKEIEKLNLQDQDTIDFYNKVLTNPFLAADIYNFKKEQADMGRTVNFSQIPSMVNIVGSGMPEENKIDLIGLISGENFEGEEGKQKYYEIATQIQNINTGTSRTMFIEPKPGFETDIGNLQKNRENQVNILLNRVEPIAQTFLDANTNLTGLDNETKDKVKRIQKALDMIESGGDDAKEGARIIFNEYLTPEIMEVQVKRFPIDFIDYKNNPFLPPSVTLFPDMY